MTTDAREIDRWEGGVGWIAYPDEGPQRAGHALVTGDGVWVVDPVDYDGLDDLLAEMGEVAGVCVALDRHKRDAATVARRHDVAVHVPAWMDGVASALDAPVQRLDGAVGDYEVRPLLDNLFWQEAALYDGATLYTPEALGTVPVFYRAPGERLGVHPALRPLPPRSLADLDVERLLVGHGEGVFYDPGRAIDDTLANARRRAPRAYAEIVKSTLLDVPAKHCSRWNPDRRQ